MANPEHLAILKQGVKVWNEWREEKSEIRPDLVSADLSGLNLRDVDFRNANLNMADLNHTHLNNADLTKSDLSWANLYHANLRNADLVLTYLFGANLEQANFQHSHLNGANLGSTQIRGANLRESNLGATVFGNIDLSGVKGLETTTHDESSIIGIDTIYRSGGNIPESFLRGCGVPETFITYARSLVGKPLNFYSCFISHSSKDKRFCERLYADLQANGVRVWYFPEDAKWGEPVWGEIDRSIKVYDKLIVVCSKNSLTSVPVQREIERALNREDKEHKNILFPITIDDYIFDEWDHPRKADVLAQVVGDFRGWSHNADKYNKAFKKFLKALKAE